MCPPVSQNRLRDWVRLAEILDLGFSQVADDLSLEGEFIMLLDHVEINDVLNPELRRVYTLMRPTMVENLQRYRENKAKLTTAMEALSHFGRTAETCNTGSDLLNKKRKVTMLAMDQQITILQKKKEVEEQLVNLELLLSTPSHSFRAADLNRLRDTRGSLATRLSLLEQESSVNMLLIETLNEQISVLKTTVDMMYEERDEAYSRAMELDGLSRGCAAENSDIHHQNENLARLIEDELRFVHLMDS